ncbi:hypothetical protein [Acinetobacter pseudolwoffii]|uniref:hypothetical protein n=1 Tax=Acinetobacter pseudolwoffii TaxID=2053287 RepID=UPI00257862C8|nr:hypothetical protein [Acinetobacter pseudolwoffii]MDM1324857.1 hypothetical protein [Acinetobacter pseudolwoffii]
MADQPVTKEKLINADKDVQVIEDFIKKPKDETVTTRFGDEIMTLKGLEEEVKKSGGYFKRYATLEAANADIANIPVNSVVKVTSAAVGGDYEKVSAGATSLTKSAYDPLAQSKLYTDNIDQKINKELGLYTYPLRSNYCYTGTEGQPIVGGTTTTTVCAQIEVKAGDIFHLKTKGLTLARPYYLTNLSNIVVYVAAQNNTVTDFIVTVAEDGFLYVNCDSAVLSSFDVYKIQKGTQAALVGVSENKLELGNLKEFNESLYLKRNIGKSITITDNKAISVNVTAMFNIGISVVVGDSYHLVTRSSAESSFPAYCFVDSDNNVIISENSSVKLTKDLAVPEGAAKLYVNAYVAEAENFVFFKNNEARSHVTQKIEEALAGASENKLELDRLKEFGESLYPKRTTGKCILVSDNKAVSNNIPTMFYVGVSVVEGDSFHLVTRASAINPNIPAYCFVDSDNNVVISKNSGVKLIEDLEVPVGVDKLYVNAYMAEAEDFAFFKINEPRRHVLQKIKELEEAINTTPTGLKANFPPVQSYTGRLRKKCPKFFNKFRNKTGDVAVCITGSSLTQGNLYTSTRSDATTRPPLLHTNDLAAQIYDVLNVYWMGQQHRRYDHPDLTYSDSEWSVINTLTVDGVEVWDDNGSDKNGLTKTTLSPEASVAMVIPDEAWQFNFIYRTDSQGGECTVSITEGNSKVEVFNGSTWVEANGYAFSMLEPEKTATKGNTIYQKRLKMRCKNKLSGGIDSIGQTKQITIIKANDTSRFNVVGFEWSPREYMFTFINAARGSHQWGNNTGSNLELFQDGDVWEFKPDLIICETTVGNWGGAGQSGLNTDPLHYVNLAKTAYFNGFGNNPDSLYEKSSQYTDCEIVFYGGTMSAATAHAAVWDEVTKQPKWGLVTEAASNGDGSTVNVGRRKTNFENYEAVEAYMSQLDDYIYVPVMSVFKEVGEKVFPTYWHSFQASGENGNTFTKDGTHLNDNGAALWAHLITPVFRNM